MGFILDGLDTESYDRQYTDRQLLGRIVDYFRPHARKIAIVSLTLFFSSIAGSGGPILISRAIDMVARGGSDVSLMVVLAAAVSAVGITAWVLNYIRQHIQARIIGDVVLELRRDVFRNTVENDLSFFDQHSSGRIVSRITSDTQDFSNVVLLVLDVISQVLLVAVLIVWLLAIDVQMSLLLLGMVPVAFAIALSFRTIARRVSGDARKVNARVNSQIQESISGIMMAKGFRREQTLYADFLDNNATSYRAGLRRGVVMNLIFPIMNVASGLGTAALVYGGGIAMGRGAMSAGEWYLFMMAVGFVWFPLISIASFWSQFQDGLSAAERVFALIDTRPKVRQTDCLPANSVKGCIEFDHVGFSYGDKEVVLPDFSLDIQPGETVAFVGHTGAGKSSIARLITRFYEFQSGTIRIDGADIRSYDLDDLRHSTGLVPQDPFLFSGTVRDNIRYGKPDADDDDVAAAAAHVGRGDWLEDLPQGLDTEVGPRGGSISLGQRQLVALARVLLRGPAILILDEATASVDPFTESQIQDGLETVMENRTAVVIAHRLSTVRNADRIIVLKDGHILEEGTHDSLLAGGGHYSELYNTYFRHQSLEYVEAAVGG